MMNNNTDKKIAVDFTKVPKNVFMFCGFEIRIKMCYDKYNTNYKGQVNIRRYLLYTPHNGGWRICQATWDRNAYTLPRLDFFFLDSRKVCTHAPGSVSEDTKRNIAAMCDCYDKQVTLARANGHRKMSVESAMNAPFEAASEHVNTDPDFQDTAVATV